jgi:hypothetical protein
MLCVNVVAVIARAVVQQAFGKTLTAATGFTALTLFNQLRMPLAALPSTINEYIQVCAILHYIHLFYLNKVNFALSNHFV